MRVRKHMKIRVFFSKCSAVMSKTSYQDSIFFLIGCVENLLHIKKFNIELFFSWLFFFVFELMNGNEQKKEKAFAVCCSVEIWCAKLCTLLENNIESESFYQSKRYECILNTLYNGCQARYLVYRTENWNVLHITRWFIEISLRLPFSPFQFCTMWKLPQSLFDNLNYCLELIVAAQYTSLCDIDTFSSIASPTSCAILPAIILIRSLIYLFVHCVFLVDNTKIFFLSDRAEARCLHLT